MIVISDTATSIRLESTNTETLNWTSSWVDIPDASAAPTPGGTQGSVTTATNSTMVAAPAAATKRVIKQLSVFCQTGSATLCVRRHDGSSYFCLYKVTLSAGTSLHYEEGSGWKVSDVLRTATGGYSSNFQKVGTGADTVGYFYLHSKDTGFPGAWSPGTPGMAGRATDGTASGDAGCILAPNAGTGSNYLKQALLSVTVAQAFQLLDILWVNSGIVVTTTTAQTINSVTLPARDNLGGTNGVGCIIGLLFTAASTNAATINNSTVTYTNSAGVGSRTATLSNFVGTQIPITPVVGTVVWFQLQAGDSGVQSIQSVTLGTSLVTGTVSLLIARQVALIPTPVANVVWPAPLMDAGIPLWPGSCLHLGYQAISTAATTSLGSIVVESR